ncbi:uncharacterized protein MONBRDRAFT_31914 [Monosiga brevicollis MX1]|uniref:Ankyrin repeat domain-containing protein 54 n=1 Tax=Monosiga brevicollis TaxID=81824 RepID=A9UW83_MONBE|nr:uncharacterized protein MONBRDRAFT_31914 [Monosiga brevicollis MX1]EDQ90720.1 predicted protein [Monosiga brevicollis MX1]|eukprot:XP_001744771.1 hypothetical protein [Monosiga brevicollis MX1]
MALRPEDFAAVAARDDALTATLVNEPNPELRHHLTHKLSSSKAKIRAHRFKVEQTIVDSTRAKQAKFREAAGKADLNTLMDLIAEDINVNAADEKHRTALHFAACQGNAVVVKYLCSHGANQSLRDMNGNTPLHLAACTNHTSVVTALLRAGADVRATDRMGKTPLDYAASHLKIYRRRASGGLTPQRRTKIFEIVELLTECLRQLDDDEPLSHMTAISSQLKTMESDEDLHSVEDVLTNLMQLTLGRHRPA